MIVSCLIMPQSATYTKLFFISTLPFPPRPLLLCWSQLEWEYQTNASHEASQDDCGEQRDVVQPVPGFPQTYLSCCKWTLHRSCSDLRPAVWWWGLSSPSQSLNRFSFTGILASERATFITPFVKLCVPAEGCSSVHFQRTLGKAAADKLLKEGAKIDAQEALRIGEISDLFW